MVDFYFANCYVIINYFLINLTKFSNFLSFNLIFSHRLLCFYLQRLKKTRFTALVFILFVELFLTAQIKSIEINVGNLET